VSQQSPVRVAILADATPEAGVGHVMRCLAMAESMESAGAEVVWFSQMTVTWLRDYFKDHRYRMCDRPINWVAAFARLIEFDIDIALVDTYENASHEITQLEEAGIRVVQVFDGFAPASVSASLVLNPESPLGTSVNSKGRSVVLDGPEYALIRQEVRDLARLRHELGGPTSENGEDERVPLVVVIAGGSDVQEVLNVSAWAMVAKALGVRVVMGPGGPRASANQEPGEADEKIILKSGSALLRDAAVADWVVSGSGVTGWELMHIGVPTGLFCVSDNQRRNFEYMTSRGWALDMNDLVANISGSVPVEPWRSARDYFSRRPWQLQRVDGLGAFRAAAAVKRLMEDRRAAQE